MFTAFLQCKFIFLEKLQKLPPIGVRYLNIYYADIVVVAVNRDLTLVGTVKICLHRKRLFVNTVYLRMSEVSYQWLALVPLFKKTAYTKTRTCACIIT